MRCKISKDNKVPKVLRNLKKTNANKKIKIRYKKLTSGNYSLYLDLWHNDIRKYEFLKIYLKGTRSSLSEDRNKLKVALSIRDNKEVELFQDQTGFKLCQKKGNANFVEYMGNIAKTEKKSRVLKMGAYKYLKKFTKGSIKIKEIDREFSLSFKNYLTENLSKRSVRLYFLRFKSTLNRLVEDDLIDKNPARNIKMETVETKREFLTVDELKLLKKTKCDDNEIRNAFLFSCYTGLRMSDIIALTFNKIQNGYLIFRQKKTNSPERMKISKNAIEIIEKQKEVRDKKVFNLPTHPTIGKKILKWVKKAGIDKHITFHCARHTFATMCLTYDIDIYTVSKLLGHRDIKTTQIYAKLIDKKKDEAVDKLPRI